MAQGLQIGQVARETGLTVDAICFYEKQHLLKRPLRTEGGFRLFSSQDLQNIHFIRRAQELGFSLNEVRELLILQSADMEACSHVRDLLKSKLSTVREKASELQKLESDLAADLKKCERRLHYSRTAGHAVLHEEGISAEVAEIEVPYEQAARTVGFLGSPTIWVDGVNIEPASRSAKDSGFACRWYPGGIPPTETLRAALREAQGQRV